MFKRRKPLSFWRKLREGVYPRRGWRRAIEYVGHRLKRLPDTPHKISLGFACGVFVSFSPLFGLHFLYAALIAWMIRGNILAAMIGTFVGNPVTFPVFGAISLGLGRRMFGMSGSGPDQATVQQAFTGALSDLWESFLSIFGLGHASWGRLGTFWSDVFVPYFVGGLLPGLIAAVIFYFLTRPLVAAYQARRRSRLLHKAQERLARQKAEHAARRLANEGR
ncbi:DUF2062 domain-containing protein [Halovulum dunhuangense]|uniref:DUF2062 domain-containing protein n=1 Tax=Halovulum dunhuangense TaxID=1505036 RepID=A0A849L5B9_9RHOB|nr:DUF2062 domain-containing protein [Halovulum dunhuangense]